MKVILPALLLFVLFTSCEKDDSFINKYNSIPGTWTSTQISYDSSGTRIIRALPYDKLVISGNLRYQVFLNSVNQVEQGFIEIRKQTDDSLKLFFHAEYPAYSSFAGSHIFGFSIVYLDFLTNDIMVLKADATSYTPGMEFKFIR